MTDTDNVVNASVSIQDREFVHQLEAATEGLMWFSEAEYPWQLIYLQDVENCDRDLFLQHFDYPSETQITTQELGSFFASATTAESWHNEVEQAEVKRYQNLVDLMTQYLTEIQVYLVGEIEIDVCILGRTKGRAIAGLTTKIVET